MHPKPSPLWVAILAFSALTTPLMAITPILGVIVPPVAFQDVEIDGTTHPLVIVERHPDRTITYSVPGVLKERVGYDEIPNGLLERLRSHKGKPQPKPNQEVKASANPTQNPKEAPTYFQKIETLLEPSRPPTTPIKYTLLYYSASWCGPCREFTPILADWYKKTKAAHPELEIVLVTVDKTEEEYRAYAQSMPWRKAAFQHKDNPLFLEYRHNSIPFLALINVNGRPLTPKVPASQALTMVESFLK